MTGLVLSGSPLTYLMESKSGENRVKICLCEGLWFRQLQLVVMILFITRLEKVSNCQSSVPGEMGSRFLALEMKPPL